MFEHSERSITRFLWRVRQVRWLPDVGVQGRGRGTGQMLGPGIGKRDGTDVQPLQRGGGGQKGWLNCLVNDSFGVTLLVNQIANLHKGTLSLSHLSL